jgi:hypothetical protein
VHLKSRLHEITSAEQALTERREEKANNKNGNPIVLKSKLLAAIPDPSSSDSLLIAESTGSVRRVDVDVSYLSRSPWQCGC